MMEYIVLFFYNGKEVWCGYDTEKKTVKGCCLHGKSHLKRGFLPLVVNTRSLLNDNDDL